MKKTHFLLGILLILGFINSTRVNMKYPTYINETYNLDDVFKLNGLSYQITECKLYEHEEFAEKYAIVQSKENQVNIVLRMSVINNTQTLQYIPLEQFILESIGWYSNFNLKYFQNINNISDYFVSIESNEKKELLLPYCYYNLYEDKADIIKLSDMKFSLNMYLSYPSKVSVKL